MSGSPCRAATRNGAYVELLCHTNNHVKYSITTWDLTCRMELCLSDDNWHSFTFISLLWWLSMCVLSIKSFRAKCAKDFVLPWATRWVIKLVHQTFGLIVLCSLYSLRSTYHNSKIFVRSTLWEVLLGTLINFLALKAAQWIYYINNRILCVCVCVFVISEISGTGRRSATLLAPTWRASPGELQQLFFWADMTRGSGEKAFRTFSQVTREPRPSRNGAILKK